ncbi:hypothetical protein SOP94_03780 [Peribacillus frigoritolerans]|uniref:hypothetical protein n=1 Tax=Peribacillus frigoritolerans TaxID=450367 RepID=UPI002B24F56A|nr:hypothetical protein [Peribacillus frigoritolerans]MEB2627567.1 hypothetical protein [Peribacillus frigoritolerans]
MSRGDPAGASRGQTAREKRVPGTEIKSPITFHGSECDQSEPIVKDFLSNFKTNLIGRKVRDCCGKSVSRGDPAGASRGQTARGKRVPGTEIKSPNNISWFGV